MPGCRAIDFRLYLITDRKLFSEPLDMFRAVEEALRAGVMAVQLREKDLEIRPLLDMAYRMRELTGSYGAKLFINERVDVAMAVNADGVHLGASGIPASAARKVAGEEMLIGVSAHSVKEARAAEIEGADFITLGPVFETPSKLVYGRPLGAGVIGKAKEGVSLPVFAIGGIKLQCVPEVLKAGADGIAVISAVLAAGDIKTTTEGFMRLLK